MTATKTRVEPALWVGSLADYNHGILHGRWITPTSDKEELLAEIQKVLDSSPTAKRYGEVAEEWSWMDYEYCGKGFNEYTSVDEVVRMMEDFEEVERSQHGWELYLLWLENTNREWGSVQDFIDDYLESVPEPWHFAFDKCEEKYPNLPSDVKNYLNWERMWEEEYDVNGYMAIEYNGQYHIFY